MPSTNAATNKRRSIGKGSPTGDRASFRRRTTSHRCLPRGFQLSVGRPDLPAKKSVAENAAKAPAHQAKAARTLGHDAGSQHFTSTLTESSNAMTST